MRAVSLMVMIPAFQAGGPGSIPGRRIVFRTVLARPIVRVRRLDETV